MALTLRFSGPDNGVFDCTSGGGSNTALKASACGGKPPYTWSITAGRLSHLSGYFTTISPPSNPGLGVSGTAYWKQCMSCSTCVSGSCTSCGPAITSFFGCNSQQLGGCSTTAPHCVVFTCPDGCCSDNVVTCADPGADCAEAVACPSPKVTAICDKRTAQMITDGCSPCAISMLSSVVTVTDSLGASVSRSLTVN